jgi:hypothetical protein
MDSGNDRLLDIDFVYKMVRQGELGDLHNTDLRSQTKAMQIEYTRSLCLEKAFPPNYEDAKFNWAFMALDSLQELECARRNALREAASNLGITKYNWRHVLADNLSALAWVKESLHWDLGLEICYAELYVGLRIWVSLGLFPSFNIF